MHQGLLSSLMPFLGLGSHSGCLGEGELRTAALPLWPWAEPSWGGYELKIIFAVVWLLNNGQFVGEPWRHFASMEECHSARDSMLTKITDERVLFFTACLDPGAASTFQAFQMELQKDPDALQKK